MPKSTPSNQIRFVTAASLFDGHDATINIMRRMLQASGAEVIHLGHNRSVREIVSTAIQEDVQGIAVTSYQGGHIEFFKYMVDLLKEHGCGHIKIFGGGGGTILPHEIEMLHDYGVTRLYSPDDGRLMGLQGMIDELIEACDFPTGQVDADEALKLLGEVVDLGEPAGFHPQPTKTTPQTRDRALGQLISIVENQPALSPSLLKAINDAPAKVTSPPILGVTGTGGAGKSSLVDELIRRFLLTFDDKRIGIISVDPSRRRTGGALLGDRIRMNSVYDDRVYMRSVATRQANVALSQHIDEILQLYRAVGFDLIILESSGIGQSDSQIVDFADAALYVMTPEYGAASQLEKIDMLDFADVVAINKFDKRGGQDALRDVRKQVKRNRLLWETPDALLPVYGTIASQFNDSGTHELFESLMALLHEKCGADLRPQHGLPAGVAEKQEIIPAKRVRYLAEIADTIRDYNAWSEEQATVANKLFSLRQTLNLLADSTDADNSRLHDELQTLYAATENALDTANQRLLDEWDSTVANYSADTFTYAVRGREFSLPTKTTTLSHNKISRVSLPRFTAWGDILKWQLQENVPGRFPFTAGVFPFKRQNEDPTRMFAGEGGPERTNKRFHYVSLNMPARRLSTAFDSVTLYGNDPDYRPDIYGKVGNSGVSIPSLDDAKKLYSGFDLCDPATSVSMTINGPAATVLAFFLNVAIDQQCEKYIIANGLEARVEEILQRRYDDCGLQRPRYRGALPEGNNGLGLLLLGVTGDEIVPADVYTEIRLETLMKVRGTVQADILKEDQAQNTCIFSTEFSLRLMGDVQQYFIDNQVNNFYSVSISGYHMAEAGANPITQLAFTLANGFTFLEYYRARGMDVDKFAPNFSFFFSNGIDPEYAVIGRVARRIWAKALKLKYGAGERAQKLKYHIQTSGRSLHAQEIGFNDIRTTLQALYAIYDNCNSLHTNAYDEAVTTPTEESVRRAMAIQLIINRELGLAKNENPLQGAFIIDELTELVEEAVLLEFERLTERGGVLGAMETMYQRGKIQEESLYYEQLKHSGGLPIVGVNTFLSDEGSPTLIPDEIIRSTDDEKTFQIEQLHAQQSRELERSGEALQQLQAAAIDNDNLFAALMEAVKSATLGQITQALYDVGGQYRRNM